MAGPRRPASRSHDGRPSTGRPRLLSLWCVRGMSCFMLSLPLTDWYQVLAVNAVPPLRRRFLLYGSRTVAQQNVELSPKGSLSAFLDYLATLQVPHRYFTHFYVVSVTSSALWAQEILRNGRLFSAIAILAPKIDPSKAMSKEQILLTWALMSAQGCRRLYESIRLAKPSNAKMWFVHWLLGWAFYAGMGPPCGWRVSVSTHINHYFL